MAKAGRVSLTYDSQTELYLGVKRSFPPQIYRGITDKQKLCVFKVCKYFDICIHCEIIITMELINIRTTSYYTVFLKC